MFDGVINIPEVLVVVVVVVVLVVWSGSPGNVDYHIFTLAPSLYLHRVIILLIVIVLVFAS